MTQTKFGSGVAWSILMRWTIKFVGLINTLILARILTPDDFGLVAMAMLAMALVEEFSTVNISLMLIRSKGDDRSHNDTAWTVGIIQSFIVAVLLVLLAPFAAEYFDEERVVPIIYVLAVVKIIIGFRNIGVVVARKNLDFAFDYRFMVYGRIAVFVAVLALSFLWRDYWGVVIGMLVGELFILALSYVMHSYRPKFSAIYFKEYMKFSLSMIPFAVAKLLNNKMDVIVVGGQAGTSTMGVYNVANELASMLTREVVLPAARGLFPNLTSIADDKERYFKVYGLIASASIIFSIPVCVGIWLVSDELVLTLLGSQWLEAIVFLQWLSIYGAASSVSMLISEHPLIAIGRESLASKLMWFRVLVLSICVFLGNHYGGVEGIAMGMAASSVLNLFAIGAILIKVLTLPVTVFTVGVWRVVLASFFMWLSVNQLQSLIHVDIAFVSLLTSSFAGGGVYCLTLYSLWRVSGRPFGIESIVLDMILRKKINP